MGSQKRSLVDEQFEELHGEDEMRAGGCGDGRDEYFFEEPLLTFDLLHGYKMLIYIFESREVIIDICGCS